VEEDFPLSRDMLYEKLREKNIFVRRYFYPLISDFPMYRGYPSAKADILPVAVNAARSVLCLPIYPDLSDFDQRRVINILKEW
jgi:dTDP-4-amino-4,6-dideoxygalactose transaminase